LPVRLAPFRTTWVPQQRGHAGMGGSVSIPPVYDYPAQQATTKNPLA
jgi:hypothetical protein